MGNNMLPIFHTRRLREAVGSPHSWHVAEPLESLGACSADRTSDGPAAISACLVSVPPKVAPPAPSHHQGRGSFPGLHVLSPWAGTWPGEAAGFGRLTAGGVQFTALASFLSLAAEQDKMGPSCPIVFSPNLNPASPNIF